MDGMASIPRSVEVHDLGRMAYAPALEVQRAAHAEVLEWRDREDTPIGRLYLVEHVPPVITISRRPESRQHLIAPPGVLERAGVEIHETDRGGDITYHGPGQLVVYPILDLNRLGLNLHGYMRLLEQVVIDVCSTYGVQAGRDPEATGVWVGEEGDPQRAKVCALGIRVRRWVAMHGLALNVTTNLEHFSLIVPCGLAGRPVTSLEQLLGSDCPPMDRVKQCMCATMAGALGAELAPARV